MSLSNILRGKSRFASELLSVLVAGCVLIASCSASSGPENAAGDREASIFDARWHNLRAEHISRAAVRTFYQLGWFSELTHDAHGVALTEEQAVAAMGNTFFLSPDGSGEYVGGINPEAVFQWLLEHDVNLDDVPEGQLKTILADYYSIRISKDVALSQMMTQLRMDKGRVLQMVHSFGKNFLPPWLSNAFSRLLAHSENVTSAASATNPLTTSETAFAIPLFLAALFLLACVVVAIVVISGRPLPQISFNPWPSPGERPLDPTNPMEIGAEFAANVELEVTLNAMHNSPQWQAYIQSLQALASHLGVTISQSTSDDPFQAKPITEMIDRIKKDYAECKALAVAHQGSMEICHNLVRASLTMLMIMIGNFTSLMNQHPDAIANFREFVDEIIRALQDLFAELSMAGVFTEADLLEIKLALCVFRELKSEDTVEAALANCKGDILNWGRAAPWRARGTRVRSSGHSRCRDRARPPADTPCARADPSRWGLNDGSTRRC